MAKSTPANSLKTQANVPIEITFHAAIRHKDPFNEVTLDVVFHGATELKVPAFWDGGDIWKVRFASPKTGTFQFSTICAQDSGLNGVKGTVRVIPYKGTNPLFKHGPIVRARNRRYLEYADGKPFFWLGDTWWMGLAKRLEWPEEFKTLTADRIAKGFTVVQIVAGLYPDSFPFDPRGANEAGFPWEADYASINPAYFDRADERLGYLVDQGISPCIVGAWGYFMQWMGPEKLERHWRYLIARYGAMPVVWCAAGEANLPWYLNKGFPYVDTEQVHKWTEVVRYIHATDPFKRLVTVHPTAINSYTSRSAIDDPRELDFDMLQTPHGEEGAAVVALRQAGESRVSKPTLPVVNGEAAYEMLGDSLPTRWTRAMFWISMMNGYAGHTYGANGIWQNNRPGDPHGNSPHGAMYGKISSKEAMHLPGSAEVGFGKRLLEKYDWQRFEPLAKCAEWVGSEGVSFEGTHWMWAPGGDWDGIDNAPIGPCYFRLPLEVHPNRKLLSARLLLAADDKATVYANGEEVGKAPDWRQGTNLDLASHLHSGQNILAIEAENVWSNVQKNPAGLLASIELRYEGGIREVIHSRGRWKAATDYSVSSTSNWRTASYDDSSWLPAREMVAYGDGPWGRISDGTPAVPPLVAGSFFGIRFVYMLYPKSVLLENLRPNVPYHVKLFDPITGKISKLPDIQAKKGGSYQIDPPVDCKEDWLLILEPTKP